MIRPFTLVTALLAAGSGLYLFAVKHQAQILDDQLAGIAQKAQLDGQRIRVLQAQWALETDPSQLAALAAQFTRLRPMQPAQMVTVAALGAALPAPGSAAPVQNPDAPDAAPDAGPEAVQVAQNGTLQNGLPLPPPPPQNVVAAAVRVPSPPAGVRPAHAVHEIREATVRVTHAYEPPPLVTGAPLPAPLPAPVPYVQPVRAVQALPEDTGSVLGMAADLAAPQPLGSGN